ncbi:MAG: hypothetical protein WAU01_01195 [Saprospiraceae bacterium]
MKTYFQLLLLGIIMMHQVSCAQATLTQRNKYWNPNSGKYYFSTQLTWIYQNDLAPDEYYKSGEMSIYVDTLSGTFLFTKEAYGWSGEMVDFVIADQKGNYIFGYSDEFGDKKREIMSPEQYVDFAKMTKQIQIDFKKNAKPTGRSKKFGKNDYGWPTKTGKEYVMSYEKTTDKNTIFISPIKYSFLPVFLFNKLNSEAKLPVNIDYSQVIPHRNMILEDTYIINNQTIKLSFQSQSPTEYFIDLNDYKKMN